MLENAIGEKRKLGRKMGYPKGPISSSWMVEENNYGMEIYLGVGDR